MCIRFRPRLSPVFSDKVVKEEEEEEERKKEGLISRQSSPERDRRKHTIRVCTYLPIFVSSQYTCLISVVAVRTIGGATTPYFAETLALRHEMPLAVVPEFANV